MLPSGTPLDNLFPLACLLSLYCLLVKQFYLYFSFFDAVINFTTVYRCEIRNDFGKAASSAELIIEESLAPPFFKQELKSFEVSAREAVRFDVRAAGKPLPVVEWFKVTENRAYTRFSEIDSIVLRIPEDPFLRPAPLLFTPSRIF